jgi:hypothetical protein
MMEVNLNPTKRTVTALVVSPTIVHTKTGSVNNFKIPKQLDDNSWVAWKGQITPVLRINKVWDHIDGTAIEPGPNLPKGNLSHEIWEENEQLVWLIISCNIKASQFVHTSQPEGQTAKEMWDNLKAIHEPHSQQSITAPKDPLSN